MDALTAIKKRRSIRAYKKDPVDEDKLNKVLEAARLAPSAANKQPWRFIIVTDPLTKEKLRAAYNEEWFIQAPVIIVGCAVPEESWRRSDGEQYWKVDLAIAMQNLVLASTELGLGTCWIGAFNEKAARKTLGIPKNIRVVAMTPLGYPAEEKGPVTERKPINDITHHDKWPSLAQRR